MTSVILVVDPNADTREMYGRLLGAQPNWRVVAASDTAQAGELTCTRAPEDTGPERLRVRVTEAATSR
jgi:hypothetical protein